MKAFTIVGWFGVLGLGATVTHGWLERLAKVEEPKEVCRALGRTVYEDALNSVLKEGVDYPHAQNYAGDALVRFEGVDCEGILGHLKAKDIRGYHALVDCLNGVGTMAGVSKCLVVLAK